VKAALVALLGACVLLLAGLGPTPAPPLALGEIVPGAVVTQSFGCTSVAFEPIDLSCPSRHFHSGIDLAAPEGTPVHAAAAGIARVAVGPGYGIHVIVTHDARSQTLYGHLSAAVILTGQAVARGELIGLVGSTGLSTGPHLHFEVRVQGAPVDPLGWLSA
jgi:murein DD-endopeptidase MepM/ murein hydrolase activator NlpD